jgi:hypothetical protein
MANILELKVQNTNLKNDLKREIQINAQLNDLNNTNSLTLETLMNILNEKEKEIMLLKKSNDTLQEKLCGLLPKVDVDIDVDMESTNFFEDINMTTFDSNFMFDYDMTYF